MPISSELRNAYQNTNYKVFWKDKEIILKVEQKSEEMNQLLEELGFVRYAFITAANPYSTLKSDDENKIKNLELEDKLKEAGYLYTRGVGESLDGNWKEESFCVFGIGSESAIKLAQEFEQKAILFGVNNDFPEIIWCV